jgi:fused signal recognition particle receptor
MFKFLKKKIKTWVEKTKETAEAEEPKTKKVKVKAEKEPLIKLPKQKRVKKDKLKKTQEKSPEKEPQEEPKEEKEKKSRFSFFKSKLTQEKFDEIFKDLELGLLQNNVAFDAVEKIKLNLEEKLIGKNLSDVNLEEKLKESLEELLIEPKDIVKEIKTTLTAKQPFVIVLVGINGSGKTTTMAKLANFLKKEKFSVCLAAADTFRAASIEQLQKHADNLKIPLIKKDYNVDPASVGFDAIQYAKKHHIDIVLIDTAGRMNTKDSLMKEMEKIIRVNKPDMKIFIGESITGNDATEQAKSFNDSIDLTGIILSKADVDEKGGTAISVSYITKKPILFLGTGQEYKDLEKFNKSKILKNLGL